MPKEMLTSGETNETFRDLERMVGIKKNAIARIAAAISLDQSGSQDFSEKPYDKSGGFRIHMPNVDPDGLLAAYVGALYNIDPGSEECVERLCHHVNEGARTLQQHRQHFPDPRDLFCFIESEFCTWSPTPTVPALAAGKGLDICAGHYEGQPDRPFLWRINEARANPHTAILGETRSGKTQLLLDILSQIHTNSKARSGFVFLAYRKDDSLDDFADHLGIEVFNPDEAPLPLNPFILSDYKEREVIKSAQEKCDLMAAFEPKIGTNQKGALRDAIVQAYSARRGTAVPYPDFEDVRDRVRAGYGDARDSLTEILDAFVDLSLFGRSDGATTARRSLSGSSCIIKLEGIPDRHRAIVASLILESVVRECSSQPRAEVDSDNQTRAIRACIVIDEAHNYLKARNIFLEKLLRESADQGYVIMLATQTAKSLVSKQDFKDFIGTFFVFRSRGISSTEAQLLTGCKTNARQQISEEIQNLPPGCCFVNRSDNANVSFSKLDAAQYYRTRGNK